jgi:MoaA/NifB/PqqE/SkfB family radical SAM enzyme
MDLSVILTYRCDSRCSMCYIWKYPTLPDYEIGIETLEKLPSGFDYINLTGGEPTLRKDLLEICDLMHPKARKLEISTNGLHVDKLVRVVRKYPDVKIRVSIEGIGRINDEIRGEPGGYERKVEVMAKLIEAGGCDLGFATTFQDENIDELLQLYTLTRNLKVEFATSALHNAFQFHKNDNMIYDRLKAARKIEQLVRELLKSTSVKNWFRAYLNLGLIRKVLGQDRLHPCTQGTDNVFIDPWADVYACNVRSDLLMGNLRDQSWDDIYYGEKADVIRRQVASCPQNCWMVSSAKTAMRTKMNPKLPKMSVLKWVLYNKMRVSLGLPIKFARYVNYGDVRNEGQIVRRVTYLSKQVKRKVQAKESTKYTHLSNYFNR